MSVGTMTGELKKMFEDKEFAGSIWGNTPPPRQTMTMEKPAPEATVSVTFTRAEMDRIVDALMNTDNGEGQHPAEGIMDIVAKLKQALV